MNSVMLFFFWSLLNGDDMTYYSVADAFSVATLYCIFLKTDPMNALDFCNTKDNRRFIHASYAYSQTMFQVAMCVCVCGNLLLTSPKAKSLSSVLLVTGWRPALDCLLTLLDERLRSGVGLSNSRFIRDGDISTSEVRMEAVSSQDMCEARLLIGRGLRL